MNLQLPPTTVTYSPDEHDDPDPGDVPLNDLPRVQHDLLLLARELGPFFRQASQGLRRRPVQAVPGEVGLFGPAFRGVLWFVAAIAGRAIVQSFGVAAPHDIQDVHPVVHTSSAVVVIL